MRLLKRSSFAELLFIKFFMFSSNEEAELLICRILSFDCLYKSSLDDSSAFLFVRVFSLLYAEVNSVIAFLFDKYFIISDLSFSLFVISSFLFVNMQL